MINKAESFQAVVASGKLDKSFLNTNTGEIVEFRPSCPFRSVTDLKAFSDDERFTKPSLTDESQYEPLQNIVARCMRGEMMAFDVKKGGWYEKANGADFTDDELDTPEPVQDLTVMDDEADRLVSLLNTPKADVNGSTSEAPQKAEQVEADTPETA